MRHHAHLRRAPRVGLFRRLLVSLVRRAQWGERHLHAAYFGAIALEGHGFYRHIAGAMFILTLATWLATEDTE